MSRYENHADEYREEENQIRHEQRYRPWVDHRDPAYVAPETEEGNMKCDAHSDNSDCYGNVQKVDVERIGAPWHCWTFHYCEDAVISDERNGFKVTLNVEEEV